jgi:small subunit ribosomal protein S1
MATAFNQGDDERLDFGAMLDDYYNFDEPQRGDIREAEILQVTDREVVVDLGVKRDGIVPLADLERLSPEQRKKIRAGDRIPVYVMNPYDRDGNLVVSINLGLQSYDWTRAEQLMENGESIECVVTGYNKGGLLVEFGRLEGFIPASHLIELPQGLSGAEWHEAMSVMIGQTFDLKVIEVNQQRRRLIFSHRDASRTDRAERKRELLAELKEGDIVHGTVTGIRDFGVFVNVGGADGLIHVSELAWHRVPHPRDVVTLGDDVAVKIIELDHEKQRIALSLRQTKLDPWDTVEQTYSLEQIVEGQVSNVVDFGAFVVLGDGIEGLLHVTEMVDGTLTEPYSYVKRGDTISLKIVSIEQDRKRIGFTQKGLGLVSPVEEPSSYHDDMLDSEGHAAR